MRGRKCSLCGGRLNHSRICTECGLDNTKSDNNYQMYHNNMEDFGELTHTHTSPQAHSWDGKMVQRQPKGQAGTNAESRGNAQAQKRASDAEARRRMEQAKESFRQRGGQASKVRGQYRDDVPQMMQDAAGQQYGGKKAKPKKKAWRRVLSAIIFAVLLFRALPNVIHIIQNLISESVYQSKDSTDSAAEYEYDPYEYLDREFLEGGEEYSIELERGEYVVGVHLPEGRYSAEADDGYTYIYLRDQGNGLWNSFTINEDNGYREEDIRLFLGAKISVSEKVRLSSENAQTALLALEANPLSGALELESAEAKVGREVEPGVYDIVAEKGYGALKVEIFDAQGNSLDTISQWVSAEDESQSAYRNAVLPEGAKISCGDGMRLRLSPSEKIVNTDYLAYYTGDYLDQEPISGLIERRDYGE